MGRRVCRSRGRPPSGNAFSSRRRRRRAAAAARGCVERDGSPPFLESRDRQPRKRREWLAGRAVARRRRVLGVRGLTACPLRARSTCTRCFRLEPVSCRPFTKCLCLCRARHAAAALRVARRSLASSFSSGLGTVAVTAADDAICFGVESALLIGAEWKMRSGVPGALMCTSPGRNLDAALRHLPDDS